MSDVINMRMTLDFRSDIVFTPTCDLAGGWGPWECWRNCVGGTLPDGTAGLVPTGDWLCWKSDEPGVQMGFADAKQAETFCVYQNGPGERTRVVDPFVDAHASDLIYEDIASAIAAEIDRLQT